MYLGGYPTITYRYYNEKIDCRCNLGSNQHTLTLGLTLINSVTGSSRDLVMHSSHIACLTGPPVLQSLDSVETEPFHVHRTGAGVHHHRIPASSAKQGVDNGLRISVP